MNLLEEYQNLIEEENTDNKFPESMQYDGLTEDDREMYEKVLKEMREGMDKANEDMKKKSSAWGDVCQEVGGKIENKTYKFSEGLLRSKTQQNANGKMRPVTEPIGFMVDGFRCPKCGRLMYQNGSQYDCSGCGYTEDSKIGMQFYIVDNTFTKTALPQEYNNTLCEIFRQANKTTRK